MTKEFSSIVELKSIREQKSRIIAEHLEGWGEEYEQVR